MQHNNYDDGLRTGEHDLRARWPHAETQATHAGPVGAAESHRPGDTLWQVPETPRQQPGGLPAPRSRSTDLPVATCVPSLPTAHLLTAPQAGQAPTFPLVE